MISVHKYWCHFNFCNPALYQLVGIIFIHHVLSRVNTFCHVFPRACSHDILIWNNVLQKMGDAITCYCHVTWLRVSIYFSRKKGIVSLASHLFVQTNVSFMMSNYHELTSWLLYSDNTELPKAWDYQGRTHTDFFSALTFSTLITTTLHPVLSASSFHLNPQYVIAPVFSVISKLLVFTCYLIRYLIRVKILV